MHTTGALIQIEKRLRAWRSRVFVFCRFTESPIGFVKNAEIVSSRSAMVGFFALRLVEALHGD